MLTALSRKIKSFADPDFRSPRHWSNIILKEISPLFTGKILNVSANYDEDKEGLKYREYFTSAAHYELSNYQEVPDSGLPSDCQLNLNDPNGASLLAKYDTTLCHTVLEHVYDIKTALANIANLTKSFTIIVVPFLQVHHTSYGDYWRFSHEGINGLLSEQGFVPCFTSWNAGSNSIYILTVAVKNKENYSEGERAAINHLLAMESNFLRKSNCHPGDTLFVASTHKRILKALLRALGVWKVAHV